MHHLYPLAKGDQLCPLGFHPQVRWPTRCKRCFRDYKEHGGKRAIDDIASSSPNLSESNSRNSDRSSVRTWTSTQNLSSTTNDNSNGDGIELRKRPSSWTSTPDLDDSTKKSQNDNTEVSVSVQLPRRRHTITLDEKDLQFQESTTVKRPPIPPSSSSSASTTSSSSPSKDADLVILKTDSLAERVRKMNLLKRQNSNERESSRERSVPRKTDSDKSPPKETEKEKKTVENEKSTVKKPSEPTVKSSVTVETKTSSTKPVNEISVKRPETPKRTAEQKKKDEQTKTSQDVQFLLHIKQHNTKAKQDDNISMTTETTDTTLVGDHELQEENASLKRDLELMKVRAEKAEREKSDILLRRLASMEVTSNRTTASEALRLQQKVNELKTQLEELSDDKKSLSLRVKELERDLDSRPEKNVEDELRRKLQAAEQLCEELMDENEDIKKELRGMEQEIDEMHDNFREDQIEEFATIRKDLEQTTKNCRILSFKLKKSERKIEQLEIEKQALGSQNNVNLNDKIKQLEEELKVANESVKKYQMEAEAAKNPTKKKTPHLSVIGKSSSADGKFSRESITRGGSQEDPAQLLRDLQDSLEREADLKEQLKFAEEEAESLRKKASRVDDENESLMMQLKKMATKARSRKLSPTPSRLTPEPPIEHDEGISDEDDPAELRVLLDLNEQEAAQLRRKVEHLEAENVESKKQVKELQEKLKNKSDANARKLPSLLSKPSAASEKKLKTLEDEANQLRKTVTEKDRSIERLQAEITAFKSSNDKKLTRTDSLENSDKVDLNRKLELIEQEASVLRSKVQNMENENDKLSIENKKLQLQSLRKSSLTNSDKNGEVLKLKEALEKIEKERDELNSKLKTIIDQAGEKLPSRTPKKVTDLTPKSTLRKFIDDLEEEIKEMRAIVVRSGAEKFKKLEEEKNSIEQELKRTKEQLNAANTDIKKLNATKESSSIQSTKLIDLEQKYKKFEDENARLTSKVKDFEEKIKKQDAQIKLMETAKNSLESQTKRDKEKISLLEKDVSKMELESKRWENKASELESEVTKVRKNMEKTKKTLEKEVQDLKSKTDSKPDISTSKELQELKKQKDELQNNLTKEANKVTELNGKYESLHEEHVLVKAQLTTEKQSLQTEISNLKQKVAENNNAKVQKSEMAQKLKEAQKKITELESKNIKAGSLEYEKARLKSSLEEKERDLQKIRKENEMNVNFITQVRKENEELKQKLDDFDRVHKGQRTLRDHNTNLENEIKTLRIRLENSELGAKSDVASTRLRYEQQLKNVQTELTSMQRQCERFKKDRDAFKQLLEAAQRTITDLKQNSGRQSRASANSGDEDDKSKILLLEQQLGCLEDQLSESRLEVSRLKTELVSERSASEIKISEMTSKLNEFEEDRLLGSGRTKVAGMKTKLELSWQKEREEQQRLIQETSTLARDLRQTLFEVERERDKERLESKRKLDQLKKANEEELEEGRKKISELQTDLLELRDAHAKLRTSNEKLRRERERHEKEMAKRRFEQDGERKVGALLQTVDELVKIAPELQRTSSPTNKTNSLQASKQEASRRSRSPSPSQTNLQISNVLARLTEASEELRKYQRLMEDEKERDKLRRSSFRRASSTDKETGVGVSRGSGRTSRTSQGGSLYRKSLSLDQTTHTDQGIWRQDDDSMSSMQSIDSEMGGRESSMDSRLSGGSTQSDIPRVRKKKRGIMGKLRSLTKGKSVDSEGSVQGSDSDLSVSSDVRTSKKDLRERISGMFKRSSSASRSNSVEKGLNSSQQRPVAVTVVETTNASTKTSQVGATTPRTTRSIAKPPTPTTPSTQRKPK